MGATGASHTGSKIRAGATCYGGTEFEALHWNAENQGQCQRVAGYTIANRSHG
jgi:hypothetical protein